MAEIMIKMSDEEVIYHTEVFIILYLSEVNIINSGRPDKLANNLFNANFREILAENLRAFLREPLKDPRFRKKFNEYFENHELESVRIRASLWLSDILVWED